MPIRPKSANLQTDRHETICLARDSSHHARTAGYLITKLPKENQTIHGEAQAAGAFGLETSSSAPAGGSPLLCTARLPCRPNQTVVNRPASSASSCLQSNVACPQSTDDGTSRLRNEENHTQCLYCTIAPLTSCAPDLSFLGPQISSGRSYAELSVSCADFARRSNQVRYMT